MKHLFLAACFALVVVMGVGQFTQKGFSYTMAYQKAQAVLEQPAQATPAIPVYCVGREAICDSLKKVGFPDDQVHVMVAIAKAESNFRADAKGDIALMTSKWSYSYGFFQIRLLKNPGSTWWRDAAFVEASLDNQAKAAYAISGSGKGDFYPWSTWRFGQYKKWL
jgi:hypothetical protein